MRKRKNKMWKIHRYKNLKFRIIELLKGLEITIKVGLTLVITYTIWALSKLSRNTLKAWISIVSITIKDYLHGIGTTLITIHLCSLMSMIISQHIPMKFSCKKDNLLTPFLHSVSCYLNKTSVFFLLQYLVLLKTQNAN